MVLEREMAEREMEKLRTERATLGSRCGGRAVHASWAMLWLRCACQAAVALCSSALDCMHSLAMQALG